MISSTRKSVFVHLCFFVLMLSVSAAQETEVDEATSAVQTERVRAADSAMNYKQLLSNINTILSSKILKNVKQSISIYSLDRQRMLFEKNAHDPLTPASTTKLFYTYAAMKSLGADFAVPTQIMYDGTISEDSVLNGNIYLVGHGDCLLSVGDIEALAERVRRTGIKNIRGDIVADDSFFDDQTDRQAYSGDRERMQALAPISALGVNRNLVTVLVSASSGGITHVQTLPQSEAFRVSVKSLGRKNSDEQRISKVDSEPITKTTLLGSTKSSNKFQATGSSSKKSRAKKLPVTGSKGSTKRKAKLSSKTPAKTSKSIRRKSKSHKGKYSFQSIEAVPEYPAYSMNTPLGDFMIRKAKVRRYVKAKPRIVVHVSSIMQKDGVQEFLVSGSPARSSTQSFNYEIRKPSLAAVGILYRSLSAEGIHLSGRIRTGVADSKAKTIAELKRPIADLINVVNKNSDNFVAEHVMKIVGAYCCGNKQCNVNAFRSVGAILDSANVPLDGCALYDGSGLSRRNKTSSATQVNLLRTIAEQPFASVFYNTMSIAGVDGTLHRRMIGTNAQNNVHAKTGTHSNVSALSGYVRTRDGERICFSMISNGAGVGGFKQLENAIAVQLAEFSYKDGTIAVTGIR